MFIHPSSTEDVNFSIWLSLQPASIKNMQQWPWYHLNTIFLLVIAFTIICLQVSLLTRFLVVSFHCEGFLPQCLTWYWCSEMRSWSLSWLIKVCGFSRQDISVFLRWKTCNSLSGSEKSNGSIVSQRSVQKIQLSRITVVIQTHCKNKWNCF